MNQKAICPYCQEPIDGGDPRVVSDGQTLHLGCYAEERDGEDLDNELGDKS